MTEVHSGLPILVFVNPAGLDRSLSGQPHDTRGAWIKSAKKDSGIARVTRTEAIDSALCYGWIDGQLDKDDAHYRLIRFTPRKPRSKWSELNQTRALEPVAAGQMQAPGLAEIKTAKADGRWDEAYAPASKAIFPPGFQEALDATPKAAAFFATLTDANRFVIIYRIGAVKTAETRTRKIAEFVTMLERGETIYG